MQLAREDWGEAKKLFYSPEFTRLLTGNDRKYRSLYKGLSHVPQNAQNMEEFLVSAGKKPPVEYVFPSGELVVNASGTRREQAQLCETFSVKRSGWGYTRLTVEAEGDFLALEKSVLTEEDFLGNQCAIPVFITPGSLHGGKNFGRLRFRTPCGILRTWDGQETDCLDITVAVVTEKLSVTSAAGRRREEKRMTVELMKLYQEFRLKRLNAVQWRTRTAEVVERLRRLNERSVAVKLFQAHLLITEERFEEAGRILDQAEPVPRTDGAEAYCYYLYLTSLYRRDEGYTARVAMNIEEAHRADRGSWQIAWLMLFLSPGLQRSASRRWQFLEDQAAHGVISPVLYLEAVQLLNFSPTLIMKIGSFERQVLRYGARWGVICPDLAGHVSYLAEKEKYYSPALFDTLRLVYEKTPSAALLQAVCTLLIKGNKTGREYVEWYRAGVEQDLRVTRLYEYFMNSLDPEEETEIPRSVLLYFAYQSNLDQERLSLLYVYIQKHREEFPELYQAYRGQLERFLLQQLYRGRTSRNLAYLYENVDSNYVKTLANVSAYVEGYAVYAEYESLHYLDTLNESLTAAYRENELASYCLYIQADIGIHYEGWDVSETQDYFNETGIVLSDADAQLVYDQLQANPAAFQPYYVGYHEFAALREKAEEALGDRFENKAFNEAILESGIAPFSVVERHVDAYIAAAQEA